MAPSQQQGWYLQEIQSISAALACLAILYTLIPKLPIGLPRLLLLLSCLPVFAWVPFSIRSHSLRSILSFSFLWTSPSKLLLLCWDLCPDKPGDGFLYFIITIIFPLHVKGKTPTSARAKQGAFFSQILNLFLFLAALNACRYREGISVWGIHVLYCLLVFFGLQCVLGLYATIGMMLLGVEIYPPFDNPFLATSLSDFWGRRWNLVASFVLRETIYAPVLRILSKQRPQQDAIAPKLQTESNGNANVSSVWKRSVQVRELQQNPISKDQRQGSSVGKGSSKSGNIRRHPLPAKSVALLASFLASGLIHELIFCCINQAHATGEVTMFFVLHGFATVLETFLRRQLPASWKLPQPVAILCTLAFVCFSAAWLFMPPVTRSGSDLRIIAEFDRLQSAIPLLFRKALTS